MSYQPKREGGVVSTGEPLNAMSVDLEDWFCVSNLGGRIALQDWPSCQMRVDQSARRLLAALESRGVRATFFVLGWIAERLPDLVREIEVRGHEVATHGYSHRRLEDLGPQEFEEDLTRALEVTQPNARRPIIGFRAPSFSLTVRTRWALDILVRHGIRYDSSIYPMGLHPEYGIAGAPLGVHGIDGPLLELPMTCAEVLGFRLPCSGGGYFRLYPYFLTKWLFRRCNRQGRPLVFYIHPWEVDPDQPRVRGIPLVKRYRHYQNLRRTLPRFERLLRDFAFAPLRTVLGL